MKRPRTSADLLKECVRSESGYSAEGTIQYLGATKKTETSLLCYESQASYNPQSNPWSSRITFLPTAHQFKRKSQLRGSDVFAEINQKVDFLTKKTEELEKNNATLTKEINALKQGGITPVKNIPFKKAKEEIESFVNDHPKGVYTLEIAEALSLDIEVVLKALSELNKEEKIGKTE